MSSPNLWTLYRRIGGGEFCPRPAQLDRDGASSRQPIACKGVRGFWWTQLADYAL